VASVDSTRDRLVEAAARLLDEGGPAAVTLREVGRLAGVSHNAPYKHFAGKADLLAAVAARELAGLEAEMRRLARGARPPVDVLRGLLRGYVRWGIRHPARFKLSFGPWTIDSRELGEAATAARTAFVAAVAAAQADRSLPPGDPERLAALLQSAAHGAVDLALAGHLSAAGKGHADPDDLVDDMLDLLASAVPNRRRTRQPGGRA
jgi:AcrR family transcriptional regulator